MFKEGVEKESKGEVEELKEQGGNEAMDQANIAHEYLQELKNHQRLSETYQNALNGLDRLRGEALLKPDDSMVKKLEDELKSISALMDGSQIYMNRLFDKLSDESKEKYLKPAGLEKE